MSDEALKEKTQKTARMLFHSLKGGTGYETWKKFDRELARELSLFFTGTLYSREVISQQQRELCAVASLTVLNRPNELRAHIHAALNVGARRAEVAEVVFQQVTYGGMPVVVEALAVFKACWRSGASGSDRPPSPDGGGRGGSGAGRRRDRRSGTTAADSR